MVKLCSLFSSSSGNCTFVSSGNTRVLVDIGVSCKNVVRELNHINEVPEDIQAILITHEHTDHIKGAGIFARRYKTPIYATAETWQAMERGLGTVPEHCIKIIDKTQIEAIGDIGVKAFCIPHDAVDPVGYSFYAGEKKITTATDLGHISSEVEVNLAGSIAVLLESNHDVSMLRNGPYPYALKQRILSDYGHLSNDNCAKLALRLVKQGTSRLVLGHLSAENNRPDLAYRTACDVFEAAGVRVGQDVQLNVAFRDCAFGEMVV